MQRILVAECKQEVSTFNPHPSTYGDFDIRHGKALFDYHRTVGTEVGGVLDVLSSGDQLIYGQPVHFVGGHRERRA